MNKLAILVFVIVGISAQARAEDPDSRFETGAALLAPFKQQLGAALRAGMVEGPVEAISACRVRAPEIAATMSVDGVRLGRSSHRLRNPANVAPEWVAPILAEYAAGESDRAPRAVTLSDDRSGYVEPIVVQPLCVTCHGNAIPTDVAARIRELYPDDRAIGFDVDDFRGVFWVEFPAEGVPRRIDGGMEESS